MIEPFAASAFPYRGEIPDGGGPFLDLDGCGHTSPRGGPLWEAQTYSDRSVLLFVPNALPREGPELIVVYFHGNRVRLQRDVVGRQGVPRQLAASGLNAVLVVPQMAVDALDSSAGQFWQAGHFARFLDEAAERLAQHTGRPREVFARAQVVIVAYSGGYLPAAFALERGGANERIRGVILLDALYGESERFTRWLAGRPPAFFVSAYSASTRTQNAALRRSLGEGRAQSRLPDRLVPQMVVFQDTPPNVVHDDFVTRAWVSDPLRDVLRRVAQPRQAAERPQRPQGQ